MSAPIILVPGFWLGAWAWDEVAEKLRADGHDVTALTLPASSSADADRSSIHFAEHVDSIVRAMEAAYAPVVLAVHSAAGYSGYAASDRLPERIAAMVYVDTAPGKPPLDPDFADVEKPLVWDDIAAEENLDGLSEERQAAFRERAVPVPGAMLREGYDFTNDARLDIPSTIIATGTRRPDYSGTRRSTRSGRSWRGSPSSATSPGSTCRRATGRCGRARPRSPRSSVRSRRGPQRRPQPGRRDDIAPRR